MNSGTYCLILRLDTPRVIQIGRLGSGYFPKGYYVYVGSALNGLEQRIGRHSSTQKKIHWHIDYLLEHSGMIGTRKIYSIEKRECTFSEKVRTISRGIPMEGFGSSDCRCSSHLFFFSENPASDALFERLWD